MTARKSAIHHWRIAPDLNSRLVDRTHNEGVSVAALLERIVRERLLDDEREQARIKPAAMRAIGTLRGDDPLRSERVRELVRERLTRLSGGRK